MTSVAAPAVAASAVAASASGAASKPVKNRVINLAYDGAYRLIREEILPEDGPAEVSRYSYDAASNRTVLSRTGRDTGDTAYSYNALNQLTAFTETPAKGAVRQVAYLYNGAGSRTSRTEAGKEDAPDTYAYDREQRLVGLSQIRDAAIQISVSADQTGGVTLSPAAAAARTEAAFSRLQPSTRLQLHLRLPDPPCRPY
jgi:YD repeat-containing protein